MQPVKVRIEYNTKQVYTSTTAIDRVRRPEWSRIRLIGRAGDVVAMLRQLAKTFTPSPF
jgi:hypothetical protein